MRRPWAASSRCAGAAVPAIPGRCSFSPPGRTSTFDRQVTAPGATWLDYRLVEREQMPLAMGRFGREVRDVLAARAEHLASAGLTRRVGSRIIPQRDLLATLHSRDLDAAAGRPPAETGLPCMPSAVGEMVTGTYRQRLTLTSGRFAMVDTSLGFALVPWTLALDRYLGRHVSGVAKGGRHRVELRAQARAGDLRWAGFGNFTPRHASARPRPAGY